MKKASLICLTPLLLASCFSNETEGRINIVCTIFPEQEWVSAICEGVEGINVDLILKGASDVHSYQPSVNDIAKIVKSDLFVYVGGESDEWAERVVNENNLGEEKTYDLLESLGERRKEEEEKEGMEEDEKEHEHEHEEGEEYDEHVWNSLQNASIFVQDIATKLSLIDPENKDIYLANAKEYIASINALDATYKSLLSNPPHDTLVFADRYPFLYLLNDYGLDYYAAFKGCSTDTNASFETVIFLAKKVDELGLDNIIITSSSDGRVASSVKTNTKTKDQKILVMDSLETKPQKGGTYLSIMKDNLDILVEASS
ncbi:MAG: zinc ABC transporter substrate-binding protein [Bacilli bacterium]|nr:zinc ABC transporter substrate-binding protein [Bacilli bacterium]